MVRRRITDRDYSLTDAIGTVLTLSPSAVTLQTRGGPVTIPAAAIVAAKRLPPLPPRRTSASALQETMVAGMPPLQSVRWGDWLLRSADGYTGRANSLLPLGDPDRPLDEAVTAAVSWYAQWSAPALVQIFGPIGFDPAAHDPLGRLLAARGWRVFQRTLVMTAVAADLGAHTAGPAVPVVVGDTPDEAWWANAAAREIEHRPTAERINALIPDAAYLTADGRAVARLAFAAGWCGTFSVHTPLASRGQGLARALMTAGAAEARSRHCPNLYLQVSADNTPAVRLYESLGYRTHHEYYYFAAA